MLPEAGFIDIEPVTYAVRGGAGTFEATSSRARLFFDFHPAKDSEDERPLMVLYSGGPGASTGILLGGNTAPRTLDQARTEGAASAPNPASWTSFSHLLYIDARGTGFSYGVANDMDDDAARAAEFSVRNFNPFLDAADIVRAILRFLQDHPRLRGARVVLAGESYGGVRTEVALHLLHHPSRYDEGAALYEDSALAAEIRDHFAAAGTTAAAQFDRAVLLQPRLSSPHQQAAAGAALEAEGSLLFDVAAETGVPFVPCKDKLTPCAPFQNVLDYFEEAGRDIYDVRKPAGDAFARYADIGARLEDPAVIADALGVELGAVAGLSAKAREGAYRLADAAPEAEPLSSKLGSLPAHDRYFEMELFDLIGAPFSGSAAKALGIERQHARYGELFLEDLLTVRVFVTNAAFDAVIWTPSLPAALAMYTDVVASAHASDGDITVDYKPGAFGLQGAASRSFRFATYDSSGHSVSLDQPEELAADIEAWLGE
jgi:pimeloyl-ACP methyl ester carboxylesterase